MTAEDESGSRPQDSSEDRDVHRADGVANKQFDSLRSDHGTVRRPAVVGEAVLGLEATHADDAREDCGVTMRMRTGGVHLDVTLSPAEARELAQRIGDAAQFADEGEQ